MEGIVQKCSVEPVERIWIGEKSLLNVKFQNGRIVQHKMNASLKMFLACMKDVEFSRHREENCIPTSLGFHDIFGFRTGDFARVRAFDQTLFIEFSES